MKYGDVIKEIEAIEKEYPLSDAMEKLITLCCQLDFAYLKRNPSMVREIRQELSKYKITEPAECKIKPEEKQVEENVKNIGYVQAISCIDCGKVHHAYYSEDDQINKEGYYSVCPNCRLPNFREVKEVAEEAVESLAKRIVEQRLKGPSNYRKG